MKIHNLSFIILSAFSLLIHGLGVYIDVNPNEGVEYDVELHHKASIRDVEHGSPERLGYRPRKAAGPLADDYVLEFGSGKHRGFLSVSCFVGSL
jgi:hypothetical protein